MDKAVLISIRPEWVGKIITGEKTVEIRKTRPKMETPFRCYIYCTNSRPYVAWGDVANGRVAGEFVCDRINRLTHIGYSGSREPPMLAACKSENILEIDPNFNFAASCLSTADLEEYLNGGDGDAWHISDLEIYDTPKELTELRTWKKCKSCSKSGYESTACAYDENCMVPAAITKAPQSWCYVEVL